MHIAESCGLVVLGVGSWLAANMRWMKYTESVIPQRGTSGGICFSPFTPHRWSSGL